ncbi:MAG: DUF1801 domain-containing protein [Cytophagales bacterium]|nr:DUF1801 domain-containing protein [Cytophagales bacterium]
MKYVAQSVEEYLLAIPDEYKPAMHALRQAIVKNLPTGFEETMSYGMIGYVVPHSIYPQGYHCDPKLPLPFISIASQKKFIALYHMGLYAHKDLLDWFTDKYTKSVKIRLDMGKSCIRFAKPEYIPFELVGELASKMTPAEWISIYKSNLDKR